MSRCSMARNIYILLLITIYTKQVKYDTGLFEHMGDDTKATIVRMAEKEI